MSHWAHVWKEQVTWVGSLMMFLSNPPLSSTQALALLPNPDVQIGENGSAIDNLLLCATLMKGQYDSLDIV